MAKKKTERSLEQMLKEALVKEDEQPYALPGNWEWAYSFLGGQIV